MLAMMIHLKSLVMTVHVKVLRWPLRLISDFPHRILMMNFLMLMLSYVDAPRTPEYRLIRHRAMQEPMFGIFGIETASLKSRMVFV